jgi:hypothetical protein
MYHVCFFSNYTIRKSSRREENPFAGANVFIEGTYDGASTAETVILVLQPQPHKQIWW